jgi:hypothetical protein
MFAIAVFSSLFQNTRLLFGFRMMAMSSANAQPVVGILSIGEMGMGVAKLLRAHDYTVSTCTAGRRCDRILLLVSH